MSDALAVADPDFSITDAEKKLESTFVKPEITKEVDVIIPELYKDTFKYLKDLFPKHSSEIILKCIESADGNLSLSTTYVKEYFICFESLIPRLNNIPELLKGINILYKKLFKKEESELETKIKHFCKYDPTLIKYFQQFQRKNSMNHDSYTYTETKVKLNTYTTGLKEELCNWKMAYDLNDTLGLNNVHMAFTMLQSCSFDIIEAINKNRYTELQDISEYDV